jgi:hypothetical protein
MALNGIGGNAAGSALDKFQQIRDQAKKKLDGADNRTKLTDLLKLKQTELATGGTAVKGAQAGVQMPKAPTARIASGPTGAGASSAASFLGGGQASPGGQGVSSAYGRAGGLEKTDPKPKLGRYVDFMA